jgi:hypothetical protein
MAMTSRVHDDEHMKARCLSASHLSLNGPQLKALMLGDETANLDSEYGWYEATSLLYGKCKHCGGAKGSHFGAPSQKKLLCRVPKEARQRRAADASEQESSSDSRPESPDSNRPDRKAHSSSATHRGGAGPKRYGLPARYNRRKPHL